MFQLWTHIVTYVDPHSDAYGKVFPGDRVLSVNGMDPEVAWKQHKLGIVDERAHPIVFVRNGNHGFHCILQELSYKNISSNSAEIFMDAGLSLIHF